MLLRLASTIAVGFALVAGPLGTVPVLAQDAAGTKVQFIINSVKPEANEAFAAWVADYRAIVEQLIADGKMSPEQTCAFRSWRVLAPPADVAEMAVGAGLPVDYIFIFDPLVDGVSYSLLDYLVAGLGEAEGNAKLVAYQEMLAGQPGLLLGSPLTGADALDRSSVC